MDKLPDPRVLEGLLAKATPGPWEANLIGSVQADRVPILSNIGRGRMQVEARQSPTHLEAQANVQLAALAPLLAKQVLALSRQIADCEAWARSQCEATCGPWQRQHRGHAPNCPVADLGLDSHPAQEKI